MTESIAQPGGMREGAPGRADRAGAALRSSKAASIRSLLIQTAKFGAVGAVGLVVDVTVFNLLRATVLSPEIIASGPIWAKVISTMIAIVVNWIGNRFWTFGGQRTGRTVREGVEFFAVSIAGMGIAVACLWFSREVLGYTSLLADNIASNVVGLALGAAFRFLLYRYWVFAPSRSVRATPTTSSAAPSAS